MQLVTATISSCTLHAATGRCLSQSSYRFWHSKLHLIIGHSRAHKTIIKKPLLQCRPKKLPARIHLRVLHCLHHQLWSSERSSLGLSFIAMLYLVLYFIITTFFCCSNGICTCCNHSLKLTNVFVLKKL